MDNALLCFTFPGGKLRHISIPATAGNATRNMSPGTGKRWTIVYAMIDFTADVNAANRYIVLKLTDGVNVILDIAVSSVITATQTGAVTIFSANYGRNITIGDGDASVGSHLGIGSDNIFVIEGLDQLRITVAGGLAGDSFSGYLTVLEIDV